MKFNIFLIDIHVAIKQFFWRKTGFPLCDQQWLQKEFQRLTSNAVAPSEKRKAKDGIADVEDDAPWPENVDDFVGDHVNPNDGGDKTHKCKQRIINRRLLSLWRELYDNRKQQAAQKNDGPHRKTPNGFEADWKGIWNIFSKS